MTASSMTQIVRQISRLAWFLIVVGALLLLVGLTTSIGIFTSLGIVLLLSAVAEQALKLAPPWATVKSVVVWLIGAVGALVLIVAVGVWLYMKPPGPDAFYTPPPNIPTTPGALIRSEPFTRNVPAGAEAWRILYTTTNHDASPAVASALVLAAKNRPAGPRPVIAWTHGTVGADPACGPSVMVSPYPFDPTIPALEQVIEQGWIFVYTDYVGLGTKGPHPYLIGEGEARSALDGVRAAKQLDEVSMQDQTIVWGHSQGGHAALWTGMIAPTYAPDVNVAAIAALAPASNPTALLDSAKNTPIGKIISSYMIRAYSDTYPDVKYDELVRGDARWIARDMATRCLVAPGAILAILEATRLVDGPIFAGDPLQNPAFADRLQENAPLGMIAVPLLIAQGKADDLVLPTIQDDYVKQRCDAGQSLEYRTYEGKDHVGVVGADSLLNQDLLTWTLDRLAGTPQATGCQTIAQ
jgi:pimeloyl-ACP methyl ester carboxylesterase